MKVTLGKKQTEHKHAGAWNEAKTQPAANTSIAPKENTWYEVTEKRKRSSKTYTCDDGTIKMAYHNKAIHYLDSADNTFKDIDNSLVDIGDGYETRANTFKTRFKKHSVDGKIFELEKSGYKVGLFSREAAEKGGCELEACACGNEEKQESGKLIMKDVKNNVDIEYIVDSEKIKENIIIKEKAESYEFNFDLSIENMVVGVSEDGKNLKLIKKNTGNAQFYIPAPFMTDSRGEYSDSVYYEIMQENPDKLSLKVVADKEWINAEDRTFPVTIDPQILVVDFIGGSYYDEDYELNIFRYRTLRDGQEIGSELRIYCESTIHDTEKVVESDLVIKKSMIDPYILKNFSQARIRISITEESVIGDFTINNITIHSGQMDIESGITDLFEEGGDEIVVPFRDARNRGGYESKNIYFHTPVLEIEYKPNIIGIAVTTPPTKIYYWPGDTFEPEGMVVEAMDDRGGKLPIFDYTIISPKSLATYDKSINIIYEGFNLEYEIKMHPVGFNDRRPVEKKENVYKMIYVDEITGEDIVYENEHYVRLELYDGAKKGEEEGTLLNAKNLNNNVIIKAENIRGIIDEENLPEYLRQKKNPETKE